MAEVAKLEARQTDLEGKLEKQSDELRRWFTDELDGTRRSIAVQLNKLSRKCEALEKQLEDGVPPRTDPPPAPEEHHPAEEDGEDDDDGDDSFAKVEELVADAENRWMNALKQQAEEVARLAQKVDQGRQGSKLAVTAARTSPKHSPGPSPRKAGAGGGYGDDDIENLCAQMRTDIDDLSTRVADDRATAEKGQTELADALEQELAVLRVELRPPEISEFREAVDRIEATFETTRDEVRAQRQHCEETRHRCELCEWQVENTYSRLVTWRLEGFQRKLAWMGRDPERCIRSPEFSACALPPLVLAVQPVSQQLSPPLPAMPTPGACSIRVWAQPGLHLVFRLIAGDCPNGVVPPGVPCRRYEHTFGEGANADARDEASRACFQVLNFCPFEQIWNYSEDAITLTFELLEFRIAGSGHPTAIAPDTPPGPRQPTEEYKGAGIPAISSYDEVEVPWTEENRPYGFDGRLWRADVARAKGEAFQVADQDERATAENWAGAGHGDLAFSKSMASEHFMHELWRSQVQAIKNKSVRRVEWRIEGCQRMLDVCRPGESVDSPQFCVAGMDRVQFHFYPRGNDVGVTNERAQACALFLSGPVRTTLRATLSVGSQARTLEHRFVRRGDTGGRNKFCALENSLDCTDAILIAVDVHEVESETPDPSVSLCLRDTRMERSSDGSGVGGNVAGSRGALKHKHQDPAKTEEVARCVSLPTLVTKELFLPRKPQRNRTSQRLH